MNEHHRNILTIDCCEHILKILQRAVEVNLAAFSSKQTNNFPIDETDLVVIGVSNLPVRRLFISRLRRFYPEVPMLILRHETVNFDEPEEHIRGEFILSDKQRDDDLELVKSIRKVIPFTLCQHLRAGRNYDLVNSVTRFIAEHYADPNLDLNQVADEISVSPAKLSRVLNKDFGISFRRLLKHIRIEEAKRMLASQKISIKEISARVGFADSHYFSRSFKEMTGLTATEYEPDSSDLIFN